jgi:alginate O-acetyltransferase complex protein AlgI
MIFTDARFFFFFLVVLGVAFSLRRNGPRKLWLLLCSYAFYAAWDWRFLSLIVFSTAVDFTVGLALERTDAAVRRRRLLIVSLVANLGVLAIFKYLGFFVDEAVAFSDWLGLPLARPALAIVLPMGISFYTFQSLSYTIDVYRRNLAATRSVLDFSLFVAFFPQLVAGPIVRATEFLPQLARAPRPSEIDFRPHLALFFVGYVKKACIADQLAAAIDPVFANPAAWTAASQWLAGALYTLQIYCDFSGYSDMAIACAGMLGYRLAINFDFPYLAASVRDFWRRWHISLSTWFRDYLYLPLGGNRRGARRTAFNLFSVFLLCGLWHGASWNFLLWGAYHGAFLSLERWVPLRRLPAALGWLYTLVVVNAGFVLFRAADLATAGIFFRSMAGLGTPAVANPAVLPYAWWGLVLAFFAVLGLARVFDPMARAAGMPWWRFAPAYGAAWALAFPWVALGHVPFIYFQF